MTSAALLIANGMKFRYLSQGTDSAGFIDLVKMPFPNFSLRNSALASHGLGFMNTFGYNANEICTFVTSYKPQNVSHLQFHPYLFSILLGGFTKIPGTNAIFISTFSIAASYVLGLYVIYLFMRRKMVRKSLIIFWLTFLTISPPVFESLRGQIYFDRIFMAPGIGLVIGTLILHENPQDKLGKRLLYCSLPAAMLISDRTTFLAALILMVLPLSLTAFRWHSSISIPFFTRTIPFGLVALTWYLIWATFINNPFYSNQSNVFHLLSFENMINTWNRLSGNQFSQFITFLGTILLFIILAALNARFIPLLIAVMLPSILIDVGGAQLNGYLTHYHQLYIPVLISLATLGYINLQKKLKDRSKLQLSAIVTIFLLSIFATITFWISNSTYSGSAKTFMGKVIQSYGLLWNDKHEFTNLMKQLSPLGTNFVEHEIRTISAPEALMPFIVQNTNNIISYFPAGVGMVDAVLVNYENGQRLPVVYPYGEPSPGVTFNVSECVQAALDQKYRRIMEIDRGSFRTFLYLRNDIK